MDRKLHTKDLINVGIFTAIYFVLFFCTGMIGYIPIFMLLLPFLLPVITGIPFMLFLTKVNKFGMITIMGIICGILMFVTGHGWPVVATSVVFSLLADLIFKSGGYKNWKKTVIGFCVFSEWVIGAMLPMWIMADSYFEQIRAGYGDVYANTLMSMMQGWVFPLLIASVIVGGVIGAYIGRAALRKHFQRAGIA